jgi:subtilisin family serine protease
MFVPIEERMVMSKRAPRFLVLLFLVTAVGLSQTGPALSADVASKVSPMVLRATANGGSSTFLVLLTSQADLSPAAALPTKAAKGQFVYDTLRGNADRTQAPIKSLLDRMGASYRSHWAVNAIRVTGTRDVVDALAARFDVAQIVANPWIRSTVLPTTPPRTVAAPNTVEWNVTRVQAPKAWARGFTGQGIVLGSIDTGQQWDHPALKPHYRGWNGSTADHNYNWYDATNPSIKIPQDPYGHGTHTAGTMVGDDGGTNQIGVAPGAQWMACRSMDSSGFGSPDTYITCFEFMIAPWDLNANNPDPSKAPVAVSNSWYCSISMEGCTQSVLFTTVQAVRAAGIVPVVAAGNSGPTCRTIGNDGPPAQYDESYTVGATTSANVLAFFSSRGPVRFQGQRIKPDISAPGQSVRSSYPLNTYAVLDGTSMATPHIAGVIALIYSAKPQLIGDVSGTEALINNTAHHINSSECSSNGTFPNNLYGYGLVDANKATRP